MSWMKRHSSPDKHVTVLPSSTAHALPAAWHHLPPQRLGGWCHPLFTTEKSELQVRCDLTDAEALRPTWEAACRCPWSPGTRSWCSRRWRRSAPFQRAADPRWCPNPGPGHSGTCAGSETVSRAKSLHPELRQEQRLFVFEQKSPTFFCQVW